MNFCTYFDSNYINKGLTCHYTLMNQSIDTKLYIICLDNMVYRKSLLLENVIPIKLSNIEEYCPNLLLIKESRQLKEYYATISPVVPKFIFDKYGVDKLFYTDADMAFWSDVSEIEEVMGDYSLMVTDHGFEPPRFGVRFNVGILGYKNDSNCREFLDWWEEKCLEWCKWVTLPDGRCADQGYINILQDEPDKFKNYLSCPHPGINLGPWNISKYNISIKNSKLIIDGIYNLICYHYHEFKVISKNSYYPTGWSYTESDLELIYEPYFKILKEVF